MYVVHGQKGATGHAQTVVTNVNNNVTILSGKHDGARYDFFLLVLWVILCNLSDT